MAPLEQDARPKYSKSFWDKVNKETKRRAKSKKMFRKDIDDIGFEY